MVAGPTSASGSGAGTKQSGALNIASGVTSLLSGFSSLQAASIQARQFKIQNLFLGLQANQEKLRAREQAVFLRKQFLDNIASANASFASRGVSTGSGIGRKFAIESIKELNQNIKATEIAAQGANIQSRLNISQNRLAARSVRNAGLINFAGTAPKAATSLLTGFKQLNNKKKEDE